MNLSPLSHEEGLSSKELDKAKAKLNDRIVALQKKRSELEGTIASLRTPHRHLLTSAQLTKAHDQKVAAVDCLREEYTIRNEIKESYFPPLQKARAEASERAREEHEKAHNEIEGELVKLGFVKGFIPETNILGIIPDMIARHPRVRQLRLRYESASSLAMNPHEIGTNSEAMKNLGEEIDKAIATLTRI